MTIIYVLKYIEPSFDIGFMFYNTIVAQLYAVSARRLSNRLDRLTLQVDVQSEASFSV